MDDEEVVDGPPVEIDDDEVDNFYDEPVDPEPPAGQSEVVVGEGDGEELTELEAPLDPTPAPVAIHRPSEYQGFEVHPSGSTLWDPRFEDPDSEEAQGLIYGTEDEEGNDVEEGVGEGRYALLRQDYFRRKTEYESAEEVRIETEIRNFAIPIGNISKVRYDQQVKHYESQGVPSEEAKSLAKTHYDDTVGVLDSWVNTQSDYLISQGYPEKSARQMAKRNILSQPELFDQARYVALGKHYEKMIEDTVKKTQKPPPADRRADAPAPMPGGRGGARAPLESKIKTAPAGRQLRVTPELRAEAEKLARATGIKVEDILDPSMDGGYYEHPRKGRY